MIPIVKITADDQFAYLLDKNMPLMVRKSVELLNTQEVQGAGNNPIIMSWAKELGGKIQAQYKGDNIAWCGLFMSIVAYRSGKKLPIYEPFTPLLALSWLKFGEQVHRAMIGDVLILKRNAGYHVCLYVGESTYYYYAIGGNQADTVSIDRFDKRKIYRKWDNVGIRRPIYRKEPATVITKIISPL